MSISCVPLSQVFLAPEPPSIGLAPEIFILLMTSLTTCCKCRSSCGVGLQVARIFLKLMVDFISLLHINFLLHIFRNIFGARDLFRNKLLFFPASSGFSANFPLFSQQTRFKPTFLFLT